MQTRLAQAGSSTLYNLTERKPDLCCIQHTCSSRWLPTAAVINASMVLLLGPTQCTMRHAQYTFATAVRGHTAATGSNTEVMITMLRALMAPFQVPILHLPSA